MRRCASCRARCSRARAAQPSGFSTHPAPSRPPTPERRRGSIDEQALAADGHRVEPGGKALAVGEENHRRVERAGPHALQEIAAPAGGERERDARERASQPVDRLGQGDLGQRVRDADPDLAAGRIVGSGRGPHVVQRVQHAAASLQRGLPGRGEGEGPPAAVAERHAEGGLEALHPPRHRGLSQVELARGAAHRARLRHRHERAHVVELHSRILIMRRIHVQHGGRPGILTAMPRSPESPLRSASIVRAWSARATPAGADAYVTHFRTTVLPALRATGGHRGAMVLRRTHGDLIRITVLTLWDSMASVEGFAGSDREAAVVEPAARAALADFDTRVEHFELAVFSEP